MKFQRNVRANRAEALSSVRKALDLYFRTVEEHIRDAEGGRATLTLEAALAHSRFTQTHDSTELLSEARRGEKDAMLIIGDFVIAKMKSGTKLPDDLIEYVSDVLRGKLDPPLKPGRSAAENDKRNQGIVIAVQGAVTIHGLTASAASEVVKDALAERRVFMDASNILKIWKRGNRAFQKGD